MTDRWCGASYDVAIRTVQRVLIPCMLREAVTLAGMSTCLVCNVVTSDITNANWTYRTLATDYKPTATLDKLTLLLCTSDSANIFITLLVLFKRRKFIRPSHYY
jgi:hypothetical protein